MYTATKSQLRESPRSIDIDVLTVKLIPKSSVALRSHSKNIHGRISGMFAEDNLSENLKSFPRLFLRE